MSDPPYDYTVGSVATIGIQVTPGDGTTSASVVATSPAGATSSPAVTGAVSGGTWNGTGQLSLTKAGVWELKWTVTGTGQGVRQQRLSVGPTVPLTAWTTYATTEDLARWLEDDPPTGSGRMLMRASTQLDSLLLSSVYAVDTNGMPTNAQVIAALRDAACAQVEWWLKTNDELGLGNQYDSVSIGKVTLSHSNTRGASPHATRRDIAPRAVEILQLAGLTPAEALSY